MFKCKVCHFDVVLDDVAVESPGGLFVCIGCYARLTERVLSIPRKLRIQIEQCLKSPVS